jgi:hypothetical protein
MFAEGKTMGYTPKKTQSLFEREATLMSELSASFMAIL